MVVCVLTLQNGGQGEAGLRREELAGVNTRGEEPGEEQQGCEGPEPAAQALGTAAKEGSACLKVLPS